MELKKIYKDAIRFGLQVDFVNKDTLKIYSKKYLFDSWLVVLEDDCIKLLHQNKFGADRKKCRYHLQKQIKPNNWKWVVKKIVDHNNYIAHRKNINMVDRVLGKYNNNNKKYAY